MELNEKIARDSLPLTLLVLVGKTFGMLVPLMVARMFGADRDTDAYYLALMLPMFVDALATNTLHAALGPQLAQARNVSEVKAAEFLSSSLILVVGGLSLLSLLAGIYLPSALPLLTRSDDVLVSMAVDLLPLMLLALPLLGASVVLAGALEIYGYFQIPAWLPAVKAAAFLGTVALTSSLLGIQSLALGFFLSELGRLVYLVYHCVELDLPWKWHPRHRDTLRPVWAILGTLLLGDIAVNFGRIVERSFASRLGAGDLSALEYADRLQVIPEALLGAGVIRVAFSHWADCYARAELDKIRESFVLLARILMVILVPGAVLFALLRDVVIDLLFGGEAFGVYAHAATSSTLLGYLPGLPFTLLGILCASLLWVRGKARVMAATGVLSTGVTILGCLIFTPQWGGPGVALSSTLAQASATLMLLYLCHQDLPQLLGKSFWLELGLLVLGSVSLGTLLHLGIGNPGTEWTSSLEKVVVHVVVIVGWAGGFAWRGKLLTRATFQRA